MEEKEVVMEEKEEVAIEEEDEVVMEVKGENIMEVTEDVKEAEEEIGGGGEQKVRRCHALCVPDGTTTRFHYN